DGGYTVADAHANIVDVVPDSFRYFRDFLPALRQEWRSLQLRFGGRFLEGWGDGRHGTLDETSPSGRTRILDPEPRRSLAEAALCRVAEVFPAFGQAKVAQSWAGLIDATPDAVPVISPIEALPGLFVATGFSGHGFGLAPGAGRLVA